MYCYLFVMVDDVFGGIDVIGDVFELVCVVGVWVMFVLFVVVLDLCLFGVWLFGYGVKVEVVV